MTKYPGKIQFTTKDSIGMIVWVDMNIHSATIREYIRRHHASSLNKKTSVNPKLEKLLCLLRWLNLKAEISNG